MKTYTTYQFNARLKTNDNDKRDTYIIKIQVLAESLRQAENLAYRYFKECRSDCNFIYSDCVGLYPLISNSIIIDEDIATGIFIDEIKTT